MSLQNWVIYVGQMLVNMIKYAIHGEYGIVDGEYRQFTLVYITNIALEMDHV